MFNKILNNKNLKEEIKEDNEKKTHNNFQECLEYKINNISQEEVIVKEMLEKEHNNNQHAEEIDKEKIK
jgi:hypothetical protein